VAFVQGRSQGHGHRNGERIAAVIRQANRQAEGIREGGDGAQILTARRHRVRRHAMQQRNGHGAAARRGVQRLRRFVHGRDPGGDDDRLARSRAAFDELRPGQVAARNLVGIDADALQQIDRAFR
jgi:hypothetical protein